MRMVALRECFRVVVDVSVMAPGEAGDGVNPSLLQRGDEVLRVEIIAHTLDVSAGMEVQMNLTEAQHSLAHTAASL